ncbi:hypothetical protein PK98_14115 [Croceibacterium mercuriale]|uniref:Lipoprotein n=1 Tax=Croceibacterium mercuriale TaxID=1572751 RepID=A0A0B2BYQ1_9SPHN|nr:hypothetical protein [Croceibacterium mercuriale]KHL24975.1 hypothetical protein PK98_14115 [Croceibacterium mercuriale]
MRWLLFPLVLALGATACSDGADDAGSVAQPAETPTSAARPARAAVTMPESARPVIRDEWVGRWIGVEGLNLTVAKAAEPGMYLLQMQYGTDADMSGSYEGVGTAEGIAFTRPDGAQVLRAASGDETGLKYLAGKTDCLKVKDGEGYCRQ